jgi:hypothetical protein
MHHGQIDAQSDEQRNQHSFPALPADTAPGQTPAQVPGKHAT